MSTQTAPVVDRLLTLPETADLLRVSPKTVRRYALEGRLPRVQLVERGIWKFKARDVQTFIDARAEEEE
jgi:excisionase family DNA binding protein